jgi:hypothetical protein
MIPVNFPEQNTVFTKPENMTDEQCGSLPTWIGNIQVSENTSFPHVVSCWELSPEELEQVAKTGKIYLAIVGHQPPVFLTPFNPIPNE